MRKFALLALVLAVLALGIAPSFAQGGTIVDIAAGNPNFSTLVAAVTEAGLVDALSADGDFTVFAPTNGAFNTALTELGLSADQLLANTDLLTDVLLYHVVAGEYRAADILAADLPLTLTTLSGDPLVITVANGRVVFNGGRASVEIADLDASNGVIHVIDNVLLPPAPATTTTTAAPAASGGSTIVDLAAANPNFSTLVAAVTAAGLADELSADGNFTVFAPTNGAFNTALTELGLSADQLLANTDLLTDVLLYHVLPNEYRAADILAARLPLSVNTLNGSPVVITFNGNRVVLNNGRATVEIPDLVASNGVIHVIDNVLLPPQ